MTDEAIAKRWDLDLPQSYREMRAAGLFDHDGAAELFLTDLEWLTPNGTAEFEPLEFQIPGLVPFAKSARVDLWCWHVRWEGELKQPIAFCPRDLEDDEIFSPAFPGASF